MKQILFLMATAVIAAFASCSKSEQHDDPQSEGNNVQVTITQSSDLTRAFFENSAIPEVWENKINTISILVYSNDTKQFKYRREVTPLEIAAGKVSFSLAESFANKSYTFFAIANYPVSALHENNNIGELEQMLDVGINFYNGPFEDVTAKCIRNDGFTMSARCEATIDPNNVNNLTFELKRTVAKVAVRTTTDPSFKSKYGSGKVVINSVKLNMAATNSRILHILETANYGTLSYSYTQKSSSAVRSDYYDNLFYLFENPRLANTRVELILAGMYDRDGDMLTTEDQTSVEYVVKINENVDSGTILRNTYYRIEVMIAGLTGTGIDTSIYASDWSFPQNVDENFGN